MRLDAPGLARLLPGWMRTDAFDAAMAGVVDATVRDRWRDSRLLTVWDRLDELDEADLDRIAEELHVEWYETGADRATKAEVIRTSDLIHAKKGTVSAVERLISIYFGDGRVMEWPEYGGEPHHFKAYTTDPTAVAQNLTRFLYLTGLVKRHSSKLDSVLIGLRGHALAHAGVAVHVTERVAVRMITADIRGHVMGHAGSGIAVSDRTTVHLSVPERLEA